MKFRVLMVAAWVSFACIGVNAAETAYVIDKLLVGVHAERDLNSAIVKVLPTGTELEIVSRDGELAEVKDTSGTAGWVDSAYLMSEAPASLRLANLERENAELKSELAAGPDASPNAARDRLTKENTELKGKLSAAKLKVGELQSSVNDLEAKVARRPTTPTDTIIAELESAKTKLARELEAAVQEQQTLRSIIEESKGPIVELRPEAFSTPILVASAVALVLAFLAGLYAMDYLNRRRHGGFRI